MTNEARKRITALEQYTELGSGFNIAMKDLEIRGAGDLLGGEQSGFINDIGFETYQKILNEAIEELKQNEFAELYKDEPKDAAFVKDLTLDTDFELLFPDDYVNNISERLNLYTKLNQLSTESELLAFEGEIIDRFGPVPIEVKDLFDSLRLKWEASALGIERLILKHKKMVGYFIQDQNSSFYQSSVFNDIIQFVQGNPQICTLKEKQTRQGLRLIITFGGIQTVSHGLAVLHQINKKLETSL
jgi:transcription-repair coupling factor (superfamily II helicase)